MDPLSLGISAIGLGMQLFGGSKSAGDAAAMAKVSADEAHQEQGINNVKQQAMEVSARRSNLQTVRNAQQAQAQATAAAVNQGAQFGSGLKGGLGEISSDANFNILGVNQAVQTGQQINTYNNAISTDRMQIANLQGQEATDQGIASLGGSIMKAGPTLGALGNFGFSAFKNSNMFGGLFGGGSPTGL